MTSTRARSALQSRKGIWSVTSSAPDSPSTTVRYQLDNSFDAVQLLADGETRTDTFNVVSKDGNVIKTISVIIHGSDGAPIDGDAGDKVSS